MGGGGALNKAGVNGISRVTGLIRAYTALQTTLQPEYLSANAVDSRK